MRFNLAVIVIAISFFSACRQQPAKQPQTALDSAKSDSLVYDTSPRWSPDGKSLLFYTYRHNKKAAELYLMKADGSGKKRLTNTAYNEWWSEFSNDGTTIYFSSDKGKDELFGGGEIFAMNLDGSHIRQLTEHENPEAFNALPRISPNGRQLIYSADFIGPKDNAEIYIVNGDGSNPQNLTNHPAEDRYGSWSPDGSKVLFQSNRNGNSDIFVMNADGSNLIALTTDPASDAHADWSKRGDEIVFISKRDGDNEIFIMNADGSNQRQLTFNEDSDVLPSWSPDGKRIAFASYRRGKKETGDIFVMDRDGSNERRLTKL